MHSKDLQAFKKIAEAGNLHVAAQALGVTQPSLTKLARRLETSLDVRLLERTARGVAPGWPRKPSLCQRWLRRLSGLSSVGSSVGRTQATPG